MTAGHEATSDVPPVISPEAKERINRLIASAEKEGATILLDGRNVKVRSGNEGSLRSCIILRRLMTTLTATLLDPPSLPT